jgi:hypothetical protein
VQVFSDGMFSELMRELGEAGCAGLEEVRRAGKRAVTDVVISSH